MPDLLTRRATKDLPAQQRDAAFRPASFNADDNTVDIVISAGARVRRMDYWTGTKYEEELAVSAEAVDLSRIESGTVQVLDNHGVYGSVRNVLGIVTRAWIEGGELMGTLRLSADPEKAGTVADIQAGILRAISVGYTVSRYEVTEADAREDGGAGDLWRATRWQPQEVSFVTVPADPGASTRNASTAAPTAPCEFVTRGAATQPPEKSMPDKSKAPAQLADAPNDTEERKAPAAPAHAPAQPQPDQTFEANRAAEIAELCTRHGVPHMSADLIRRGADLSAAKGAILDVLATRDAAAGGHHNTRIETVRDEVQTRLAGMEQAIYAKLTGNNTGLDDNGRQFRHLTLLEMGREHMERAGIATRGLDRMQIAAGMLQVRAAGMHTTADFGVLFNNVAHRRLGAAYAGYPASYTGWARQGPSLSDFKPVEVISMGSGPDLLQVNEHGEYKYGTFGGSAEQYKLATYGRIVAFTRQAIINDDLRVLDRGIALFGSSARRLENRLIYEQLTGNPKMGDGKTLFHVDHGNLLTGGASALSLTSLQSARALMRKQKSASGEAIAVAPAYLVVPPSLETAAYQLTSNAYTPASPADVNDFRAGGRTALEVIVEPLLEDASTTAWYLVSDNAVIDTVEYAYLDGASGPVTETRVGFEVDGTEVKCRLDFAAKALDWRGIVKANGA